MTTCRMVGLARQNVVLKQRVSFGHNISTLLADRIYAVTRLLQDCVCYLLFVCL